MTNFVRRSYACATAGSEIRCGQSIQRWARSKGSSSSIKITKLLLTCINAVPSKKHNLKLLKREETMDCSNDWVCSGAYKASTSMRTLMNICGFDAIAIGLIALFCVVPFSAGALESFPCSSCFVSGGLPLGMGELKLSENPADPSGRTKILNEDLYFLDLDEMAWKAGKGDVTDGASIPALFRPIIGSPFDQGYLPAAVMHDHYTDPKHLVRPWWTTDRMFYHGMRVRNLDLIKAAVMYYAVYVFGPHWDELEEGTPCGPNCTFIGPVTYRGPTDTVIGRVTFQPSDYDLSHASELEEVKQLIINAEKRGAPLTLSDLENLAAAKHKTNPFINKREVKR